MKNKEQYEKSKNKFNLNCVETLTSSSQPTTLVHVLGLQQQQIVFRSVVLMISMMMMLEAHVKVSLMD